MTTASKRKKKQNDVPLKKLLIVPDVHRPYHSRTGWNLLLQVGKDLKPDIIVIIGDYMDCYAVSDHERDPKKRGEIGRAHV